MGASFARVYAYSSNKRIVDIVDNNVLSCFKDSQ